MIQDQHLDKVLQTVQTHSEEEFPGEIVKAADWCHLYHLSRIRTSLIRWIPIEKEEEILEFGAECGALTGYLADQAASVTALELDPVKTEINRTRNRKRTNIRFVQGDFSALKGEKKRFDKIFLIGSLPLAELYLKDAGINAYSRLLSGLKELLKPEGRLILALPNRFGLKYFAGCREDYFGAPFTGLEDYYYHKGMRTFGKKELSGLLIEAGFPEFRFYYPYPDYRFMGSLYTDDRLPERGELNTNLVCYDQDRYVFFDETKVFDSLGKEGLFPELTNSFLVITGTKPVSELIFTKYSVERAEEFGLRTDLCRDEERAYARKTAFSEAAKDHVSRIYESFQKLRDYYSATGIEICDCTELQKGQVEFPLLKGETLQQRMEDLVIAGDERGVEDLLEEYRSRLGRVQLVPFRNSPEFCRVFGDVTLPEGLEATEVSDIDLIFSNILLTEEGWKVIDYEWTFDFPVPLHFLLYRAYFLASHQIQPCSPLSLSHLLEKEGIGSAETAAYEAMEKHFQSYVIGDYHPERDLVGPIGHEILPLAEMDRAYHEGRVESKNKGLLGRRLPWKRG